MNFKGVCIYYTTVTDWWFSPGTPVSSTDKTDRHDITETIAYRLIR